MKRNRLIGLLSILLLGAIGGAVVLQTSAEEIAQPTALEEVYGKNERVEIPEKKITVNGKDYDTTVMVTYPDGSSYTVSNGTFETKSAGVYSVVYYTVVDGKYYEEKDTFLVNESAFSVSGNKSAVAYGHHDEYATDQNGLVLELAPEETFYYNKIIDLNDFKTESVLTLFTTPATLGTEDAQYVKVTFTDIYDASNSVTIEGRRFANSAAWAHENTYFVAYANGQEKVGIEPKTSGVLINGGYYAVHKDNDYGSYMNYSLSGYLAQGEQIGDKSLKLFWDYENRAVYSGNGTATKIVSYLNNPLLYSKPWGGFTTGEVFMSISATGYNSATFNCVITQIADFDLSQEEVESTSAPFITMDYAGHKEDELPQAVVGIPYTLYDATAWDFYDGALATSARVYYGYYGDNSYQVPVVDGMFTPAREGLYTIVYETKNKFGKTAQYFVDVPTLAVSDLLSVEINEPVTNAISGNIVQIASGFELRNAFGNSSVEITVSLKSNPEVAYKVDKNELTFLPYYAGTYEVKFTAKDYLKVTEETFDIVVSANPEPFITSLVNLPKYLVAGNTYQFPTDVYGYDLSNGVPVEILCKTTVVEDSKEAVKLTKNGVYTVGDAQSVKVVYTLENDDKTIERTYTIPVVSVEDGDGNIDVTKYFVASVDSTTVTADEEYVYLRFATDSTIEFINPLRNDEFNVGFLMQQTNFTSVDVFLTSVEKTTQSVKVSLKDGGKGDIKIYINDMYKGEYFGSFTNYLAAALNIQYVAGTIMVDTASVTLETYENGEKFEGFKGTISFKIGVTGVTTESKLALVKLNNHLMYNFTADLIDPELIVSRMIGERDKGEKITFEPAVAYDVLTGYVPLKFSISHPYGGYVTAVDGTVLDGTQAADATYTIVLEEFGKYTVSYQGYDGHGNRLRYNYAVSCEDSEIPTVSLTAYKMTAKTGKIVIPKVSASDNITETNELEIAVTLLYPNGRMVRIVGDSFEAKVEGTYILFYSVFDEMGHFAQARCEITVTNE